MSKTVPFSDLGANVDALFEEVVQKHGEVVLTRDGKEVAKVVPVADEMRGPLYGSAVYEGDIVSPLDVEWDAMK